MHEGGGCDADCDGQATMRSQFALKSEGKHGLISGLMPIDRRRVLQLLPASGLAVLTGCGESDEEKVARMQKAMENAKPDSEASIKPLSAAPDPKTAEEKAAEDVSKRLILFCAADLGDTFQRLQSDLMRAAVRTLEGYRYKVLDAQGDIGVQLDHLGQAQRERPVWLLLHPVEARLTAAVVEGMRGGGIRVIGLDQRLPENSCDAVIYCDQARLGQLAGQVVVEALRRKAAGEGKPQVTGRVVQIRGRSDAYASRVRSDAFFEALKAEPGIVVVHDAPGDWTVEGGKARAEDARRLQGSFDVIFAHSDAMAMGASQAMTVAQVRENILIVGVDGAGGREGGLELLRRGVIDATIWQPMPMEVAFLQLQKSGAEPGYKMPARIEREPVAITPKSLDEFMKRMRAVR